MKAGLILRWGGIVGLCMVMALGGLEAGRAQDRTGELAAPLDTGFTYQGELTDGDGSPIATACDFQFGLWDSASGGAQLGGISAASGIQVSEGPFSAPVNAAGMSWALSNFPL